MYIYTRYVQAQLPFGLKVIHTFNVIAIGVVWLVCVLLFSSVVASKYY